MIRFFKLMTRVSGLVAATGFALMATTVHAQNSIETISVSGQQGGVTLDEQKLADPKVVLSIKDGQILKVGKRRICKLTV